MALKYPGVSSLPSTGLSGGAASSWGPPIPTCMECTFKGTPASPAASFSSGPSRSAAPHGEGGVRGVCGSVGTSRGCVRGGALGVSRGLCVQGGALGGTEVRGILESVCPRRDAPGGTGMGASPAWWEHPRMPQWRDPDVSVGAPQGTQVPLSGTDPPQAVLALCLPP